MDSRIPKSVSAGGVSQSNGFGQAAPRLPQVSDETQNQALRYFNRMAEQLTWSAQEPKAPSGQRLEIRMPPTPGGELRTGASVVFFRDDGADGGLFAYAKRVGGYKQPPTGAGIVNEASLIKWEYSNPIRMVEEKDIADSTFVPQQSTERARNEIFGQKPWGW